jgi:hypothetical protein
MARKKKAKSADKARTLNLPLSWSYGLLAAVVLFVDVVRIRLLSFPLERDEGEYAYAGQMILHGIVPYKFCYSMKLPGTDAAYALIMALFGQTPGGIHFGLLLVNSAAIVLLYFLAERLFGRLAGVVASASLALLSIGPSVLGFAAHATQFVVLLAVGGILILLKAIESQRLALFLGSGVLLGLAFTMKQPGIFFVLFSLLYLIYCEWKQGWNWRKAALQEGTLLAGAMLPFGLTCLIMLEAGIFPKFWFWTFSYARQYETVNTFSTGMAHFWLQGTDVIGPATLIWLIAAAGLAALLWGRKTRIRAVFPVGFLVFSFAAVCPGLYFRNHYFVLLLPAVSLLCGFAVSAATEALLQSQANRVWAAVPALCFVLAFAVSVAEQHSFLFEMDPLVACRTFYPSNPFTEAPKIADFLRSHSAEGERIAVVGSEPEIYFYAKRRSATGYIYMYPLMEPQPFASSMQKEMISEIEAAHPNLLVYVDTPLSWLPGPNSDRTIFTWAEKYVESGFQLVGVVDMFDDQTEYHWEDAGTYRARSPFKILIFKRTT